MLLLFRIEVLKYLKIAVVLFVLHLLALTFLNNLGADLIATPLSANWKMLAFLSGVTFGITQMSSHKRTNRWIYLLHRPLHHKKILVSLVLAAFLLLSFVVVLPFGLLLVILTFEGDMGVEFRHFNEIPLTLVSVYAAYLAAGFAILNPQRFSYAPLILVTAYGINFIGLRYGLVLCFLSIWLFFALFYSFKHDYSDVAVKARELLIFETPIQFAMFLLISVASYMVCVGIWMITATTPYIYPEPETSLDYVLMAPEERMIAILAQSSHPDNSLLQQQIEIGEILEISWPSRLSFPIRNQRPALDNKLLVTDEERKTNWRFSHTEMLYKGTDIDTKQAVGWLSPLGFTDQKPGKSERFDSIPWATDNQYIINDRNIYQIDWNAGEIVRRFSLGQEVVSDQAERFSDSLTIAENVTTLISNDYFYIFRSEDLMDFDYQLSIRARLPIPPNGHKFMLTNVVELIDGYLVLFMAHLPNAIGPVEDFASFHRGEFLLYRTDDSLNNELIVQLYGKANYSNTFIYSGLIASPGMRLLVDLGLGIFLNKDAERTLPLFYFSFPPLVLLFAIIVSVVSAIITSLILNRTEVPKTARNFWIAANAFSGLLGILSMILGLYWKRIKSNPEVLPDKSTFSESAPFNAEF